MMLLVCLKIVFSNLHYTPHWMRGVKPWIKLIKPHVFSTSTHTEGLHFSASVLIAKVTTNEWRIHPGYPSVIIYMCIHSSTQYIHPPSGTQKGHTHCTHTHTQLHTCFLTIPTHISIPPRNHSLVTIILSSSLTHMYIVYIHVYCTWRTDTNNAWLVHTCSTTAAFCSQTHTCRKCVQLPSEWSQGGTL